MIEGLLSAISYHFKPALCPPRISIQVDTPYASDRSTKEAQKSSSKRVAMASRGSPDIQFSVRAVKAEFSNAFKIVGNNVKGFGQNLHATALGTINRTLVAKHYEGPSVSEERKGG